MVEEKENNYWVCRLGVNNFLVASIETPRFCFAGTSKEEVIEKATKALDAYLNDKFNNL